MSGSDNYTNSAPGLGFDQAWIDNQLKNGSGRDLLAAQILSQKSYDKWSGEGAGSVLENARLMASRLSDAGIKRLEDFGQKQVPVTESLAWYSEPEYRTEYVYDPNDWESGNYRRAINTPTGNYIWKANRSVYDASSGWDGAVYRNENVPVTPEIAAQLGDPRARVGESVYLETPTGQYKQEYVNKATGEVIPAQYDRAGGNIWGGTFAGDGSTSYGVSFNEMGMPVFYTQYGGSTSDWGTVSTVLSMASMIPGPWTPFVMAANAIGNAYNGNYVGAALNALGAANAYGTEFLNTSVMDPSVPFDQASAALDTASGTLAQNLSTVQTAAQAVGVLNAIDKRNLAGVISGLVNIAPQVGITIPADYIKPINVAATASAISKGDWAGALNSASLLMDNPTMRQDTKLAAQSARMISALKGGNPADIFSSAVGFAQLNRLGPETIKSAAQQAGVPISDEKANQLANSKSEVLSPEAYAAAYPDLAAAYGGDFGALEQHYAEHGAEEGRDLISWENIAESKDPDFNPEAYAASYKDLADAFGGDLEELAKHYTLYGEKEGRGAFNSWEEIAESKNPGFDAEAYAAKYPDLAEAFGNDAQALAKHFATAGINEGRDPTIAKPSVVEDLQNAGLTENPDFAQPGAVDEAMAAFQKGQEAAQQAQAQTPDVQEAKSNYTGEYSGMYFDPTYIDSEGNTGAYRPIPEAEEGAGGTGTQAPTEEPSVTPSDEPGTTTGGEATVPTQEEQQGAIDELLKELAPYEQQPAGGTEPGVDQGILDELAGAGLTEQPVSPVEIPTTPVVPTPSEPKAPVAPEPEVPVAPEPEVPVTPAPEAPVTPPAPSGVTADEVQTIVDQALQNNPSLTEEQVRTIVQDIVSAVPEGLNADTVQQLVDSSISDLATNVQGQIGDVQTALGQQIGDVQAQLQEQIKAAQDVGMQGDAALQAAIDSVAANTNATREEVLAQLGTTEAQLRQDFADQIGGVQEQLGGVQSQLASAIEAAKAAGLEGDAALQSAIDSVAADVGSTREDVLNQLGTTEASLRADFAEQLGGVQEQIGGVQSQLSDAIAAAKAAGLQGDAALQSAIDSIAADVGSTREDVLGQLGKTETQLREDFAQQLGGVQEQLGQQLGDVQAQLQEQIQAAQDIGLKGDAALQAAIDSVAANTNATRDEVLSQLGATEDQLRQDFAEQLGGVQEQLGNVQTGLQEQIGGVQSQLADAIEAAKAAGLQGDAALQSAIDSVASDVGSTREDVLGQLGKTETQLRQDFAEQIGGVQEQLAGVGADLQSKYGELSAAQKQFADDLQSTGLSLQEAIDLARQSSTEQIQQVQQELGQQFETGLGAITQQMQDQYAALTAAQQAEVNARTEMGQSMADAIAAAQASTGQQISDLESSLTGQIGQQSQQFQNLLQQYRDLGMSEDAALRQTIDDLGSALGGQIAEQGSQYQQGLSNLEQQFKGMYDSSNAATQDRFNQLSADQQALAASLASSTGDLQAAIDAAAQQTSSQFTQLEDLFGGQLTGLQGTINQRIDELMAQQGLTQAQAQARVDQELSEMRDYFGTQLAGTQQQTQQAIGGLGSQISGIQAAMQQQQAAAAAAEAQRQQAAAAEAQRQQAAAAAAQRQNKISQLLGQGQQTLQSVSQQLPQAIQQATSTTTPIYGEMGPYLDVGSALDFGFFKPSPEKQAATNRQQPTKIAAGGYIDDLLAEGMSVDDLLNLLR